MNYELAKQLKGAGFLFIEDDPSLPMKIGREVELVCNFTFGDNKTYYCPTLSELIKACGDGFNYLERFKGKWFASECGDIIEDADVCKQSRGKTPEEAVAKLWLELNKKD